MKETTKAFRIKNDFTNKITIKDNGDEIVDFQSRSWGSHMNVIIKSNGLSVHFPYVQSIWYERERKAFLINGHSDFSTNGHPVELEYDEKTQILTITVLEGEKIDE